MNSIPNDRLIRQTIQELDALKAELRSTGSGYKRKLIQREIRGVAAQLARLMTA